jgi:hypothetical protein
MSRQTAFEIPAATGLTAAEVEWVGQAAERVAASDAHFARYMRDGTCWCGGRDHEVVVYSPALIRDAMSRLGVDLDRAGRLVRAAEDAAGCGPEGKWGF